MPRPVKLWLNTQPIHNGAQQSTSAQNYLPKTITAYGGVLKNVIYYWHGYGGIFYSYCGSTTGSQLNGELGEENNLCFWYPCRLQVCKTYTWLTNNLISSWHHGAQRWACEEQIIGVIGEVKTLNAAIAPLSRQWNDNWLELAEIAV